MTNINRVDVSARVGEGSSSEQRFQLPTPRGMYRKLGKRVLDVAFVCATAPVVVPVIAVLAVVTAKDGHNPFFGHKRVGRDGREFRCWKIRSMVPDAEAKLQEHLAKNPAAKAEWEQNFKLDNDPRITPIGHFLRRSSFDELPQILNILMGDMSVVGPRPVTRKELDMYGPAVREYQAVRPGLTGPWQVGGRNDLSYEARVALDVGYSRKHGYWRDTAIILGTIKAVLGKTGR